MLSVSHQPAQPVQKKSISFAPEVNTKEEQRAIRKDKEKITRLFLQSDVAFDVDKSYALQLLEEVKFIIDKRFSDDESLMSKYSVKMSILNRELGNV